MNLLIADDHPTNLKLLRAQLEAEGHTVFEAHDGVDALALLERQRVDAVISDILMPRMDGYRLCREIRKHARLRDLPIIIYSSTYTEPKDEKLALDMGADKYLKKPASVATIVAALHEVVAQPHAAPRPDVLREVEVLKNYNERLVSKLKKKNTELLAQTEALRLPNAAMTVAANAIVITDRDGSIVWANPAFSTLTGYTLAEAVGKNPRDLVKSGQQERAVYEEMWATILAGRIWHGQIVNRRKDGSLYPEEQTITPVRDANGEITHFIAIKQDITERKQAREEILQLNASLEERVQQRTAQLEFANKQMESFAYSVSHDLRSPLNAIDGFSSLLEKTVVKMESGPLTERSAHYLSRIRAGVSQMGELIDALLTLAQVSRSSLLWEQVDLSALAEALQHAYQEREPGRATQLHVEAGLLAQGDPRLLKQVFDNLLGNAWKFSAGQARTEITVGHETSSASQTVYFVRDNGAGFDMAYADKLFATFQRLHTQDEFAGTGIGLATVQRIIERHGGKIWGESAPGCGATFYFTLGTDSP